MRAYASLESAGMRMQKPCSPVALSFVCYIFEAERRGLESGRSRAYRTDCEFHFTAFKVYEKHTFLQPLYW